MAQLPLDGLDQVDWARLEHAYGPATDVPAMLRELASNRPSSRAFDQLFSCLCHQGSVYSATPAAIPFLIQLLEDERRSELVHLLGMVAEAGKKAIGMELSKGIGVLSRLLASEDPMERESAAKALGAVSDHKDEAIEALREHIKREDDEAARVAMTEALAALDEKFNPSGGAPAREKFRAAYAAARRGKAKTTDGALDEIAANWRAALEAKEGDAGQMVVLGKAFPRMKRMRFYAALLAETTVPLEAVVIARELLALAFDDRRRWGSRGCQKTHVFEGKHWTLVTAGGSSWFVPAEEQMAFGRALARFPSAKELQVLIDRLESLNRQPPANARQGWCCEFVNVQGKAPASEEPLNADQRLAVGAVSKCDAVWDIATNLWLLFSLPGDRASFAALLDA